MSKNTEAIICLILFSTNFPIVPMAAIWYSRPILIKLNSKFRTNSKMLFPSVGGYMLKNTEAIICFMLFFHQFSDRSCGSYMI